ncbi:tryptophanase [Legionella cincinnatiensis]|uniref:Tyrosine phenol-lyase n=1 Tax=Legionella cincinnatiensis TaxID=28085 RepID=A0A378IQL9_9GAMM|nr:tryptophanase [Legionella cincinnatiensis]KTC92338.1 Tyrosine phenol-lyase [Legionella cincinnatiensis]STX36781.1 Tyrosine phenol-lyase [Legionella cincinnatiensis]
MKTIIEPFRIKMTEAMVITERDHRIKQLEAAHYNMFLLNAQDVTIDLLTDSGTGAMSTQQWAAMMLGDESYAGSTSWQNFQSTVREITGFKHIFPTHQGRAAERILSVTRLKPGDIVPSNSHFDTTRANIEYVGAATQDLLTPDGENLFLEKKFKGDMDLNKLEQVIKVNQAKRVPFCMLTITNNAGGGQPVSMGNIAAVKSLLQRHNIPLILDSSRFAENAYFIKEYEPGYKNKTLIEIANLMFQYADATTMSAKKDGMANIGGFFACHNEEWANDFRNMLILTEGFPTYGGLAGRDLDAIAVGLKEALEYDYQRYRHATIEYIATRLIDRDIPIVRPAGGHAIFLDAASFCPHISFSGYPGIGLVNEIFIEGGVRGVELGTVMFGRVKNEVEYPALHELVRLAFPRRVYTQSHFDYIIEVIEHVWKNRKNIPAYTITQQAPFLRHFTAHFKPMN